MGAVFSDLHRQKPNTESSMKTVCAHSGTMILAINNGNNNNNKRFLVIWVICGHISSEF